MWTEPSAYNLPNSSIIPVYCSELPGAIRDRAASNLSMCIRIILGAQEKVVFRNGHILRIVCHALWQFEVTQIVDVIENPFGPRTQKK